MPGLWYARLGERWYANSRFERFSVVRVLQVPAKTKENGP